MAKFLKYEYQKGGKGFTFKEDPLCIWYDEDGMKFSKGTAAQHIPMRILSWNEVEERTHDLITAGKYMEETDALLTSIQERQELASYIYFFFRDEYGTMQGKITEKIGYPDATADILEHLSSSTGIDRRRGIHWRFYSKFLDENHQ
jgi:hypothetical protein